MSVADFTPDLEHIDRSDRAFLGHPKGLGYLAFVEACERFSYYSMQTLLTLYMVKYLLVPERMSGVLGLDWLQSWHYAGLEGQPLSSAIYVSHATRANGRMMLLTELADAEAPYFSMILVSRDGA